MLPWATLNDAIMMRLMKSQKKRKQVWKLLQYCHLENVKRLGMVLINYSNWNNTQRGQKRRQTHGGNRVSRKNIFWS